MPYTVFFKILYLNSNAKEVLLLYTRTQGQNKAVFHTNA